MKKPWTELSEGQVFAQLTSTRKTTQNDSEMKVSSSVNQEKSFMSSSKSETDSEPESSSLTKPLIGKKDQTSRELNIEELEKNVAIQLTETETMFTFYLPSTSYRAENEKVKEQNVRYKEYQQKRIGSDNYIARPVQTFNYQHKKLA